MKRRIGVCELTDKSLEKTVPVRMAAGLVVQLDALGAESGATRSDIIREAVSEYVAAQKQAQGTLVLSAHDVGRLCDICTRFDIERLELFGSFARGEASQHSDVDLLYTLKPGAKLGWLVEDLTDALADIFHRPVDLVSSAALHPQIAHAVLAEKELLYAA